MLFLCNSRRNCLPKKPVDPVNKTEFFCVIIIKKFSKNKYKISWKICTNNISKIHNFLEKLQ